jgi:hypothetical protein
MTTMTLDPPIDALTAAIRAVLDEYGYIDIGRSCDDDEIREEALVLAQALSRAGWKLVPLERASE